MRAAIVLALLVGVGCYHPDATVGAPCAAGNICPDEQQCDTSQSPPVCVTQIGMPLGDAAIGGDAAVDAAGIDAFVAACGTGAACTGLMPVCDSGTHTCRVCKADSECPSDVCNEQTGACIAAAAALYIDPAGADAGSGGSNDCTNAVTPCATLSHAALFASATRTAIRVAAGNYSDSVLITSLAAPLLISGPNAAPAGTTITYGSASSNDHLIELRGGGLTIEGITLVGGKAEVLRAQKNGNQGSVSLTLNRSVVMGGAGGIDDSGAAVVTHHLLVSATNGIGVHVAGGGSLDLERSTIVNNPDAGISITGSTFKIFNSIIALNGGGGVVASGTITGSSVLFDTFVSNTLPTVSTAAGAVQSANAVAIVDSIFAFNTAPQIAAPVTATHSLFTDVNPGGAGNFVAADPDFVSLNGGDYHLTNASPAVDVGIDEGINIDIDGDPRPHGAGFDIGADELSQ